MFLMFRLGRPDVLPELDLGVQKGIQMTYRMRKLPTPAQFLRRGQKWAPYRTVASWFMCRVLELPQGALKNSSR
jgi:3-methyladenine DNA glycosylase/8-oxoguanine DNA glycosylase